ncbi:Protein N-acetyltransferase, RimJ/RimL family [Streptomyces sp. DvalAA-14]|uniref:GNAT family N-acetyltransferase n=1 Tax=unclassified Streptomyces TaxID=2593676 RepID=UPI00081B9146|nr:MULTISPECIES: GNAT family N-acetyltransferase [unclassified Streptomyces]MYS24064.1 GNAT family N-acetyltransferase [Streptomyces sp. SID4948]SCE42179.1 Protein N-acetyltransferase, RimJ/RimL family [Streptomyces sp. DvalAA-14]
MTNAHSHPPVELELRPWSQDDFWVLGRTNTPEMTDHLGGPEDEAQLAARLLRYLTIDGDAGRMYTVRSRPDGEVVGSIGFWSRNWQGEDIYETGWGVLPEFQGRGIAALAARALIREAARLGSRAHLHAFPAVDHPASNAVCRKAGFTLLGECRFEYPKGTFIRSNDWVVDLPSAG